MGLEPLQSVNEDDVAELAELKAIQTEISSLSGFGKDIITQFGGVETVPEGTWLVEMASDGQDDVFIDDQRISGRSDERIHRNFKTILTGGTTVDLGSGVMTGYKIDADKFNAEPVDFVLGQEESFTTPESENWHVTLVTHNDVTFRVGRALVGQERAPVGGFDHVTVALEPGTEIEAVGTLGGGLHIGGWSWDI